MSVPQLLKSEIRPLQKILPTDQNNRVALKALVQEVFSQGVTIRDIAKCVGNYPFVIHTWIYSNAIPNNKKDFDQIASRLLALLDSYKENEGRILEKMLITKRGGLKASALADFFNMKGKKVKIYLENLIRRGLVRSNVFCSFGLTPEGITEARWIHAAAKRALPNKDGQREDLRFNYK